MTLKYCYPTNFAYCLQKVCIWCSCIFSARSCQLFCFPYMLFSNTELPLRLFGGHSNSSGRVEVSYGGIWWGICPTIWTLSDATVVCNQLGFKNSADFANSATVNYPDGHDKRFYLMSSVNCTGTESNIGECERVYGTRKCESKDFALATCARKSGNAQ